MRFLYLTPIFYSKMRRKSLLVELVYFLLASIALGFTTIHNKYHPVMFGVGETSLKKIFSKMFKSKTLL